MKTLHLIKAWFKKLFSSPPPVYIFGIADLVIHRKRPNSYGFIDQIEGDTYMVQWLEADHRTVIGVPEMCLAEDLEPTYCKGCGESQCWCGIGR